MTSRPLKKANEVVAPEDQCEWRLEELKVQSNNLKAWENRLQNELRKCRADVIHYRQTKGDYYILSHRPMTRCCRSAYGRSWRPSGRCHHDLLIVEYERIHASSCTREYNGN